MLTYAICKCGAKVDNDYNFCHNCDRYFDRGAPPKGENKFNCVCGNVFSYPHNGECHKCERKAANCQGCGHATTFSKGICIDCYLEEFFAPKKSLLASGLKVSLK